MIGNAERELVREFCKRYCAVNAQESEPQKGYFRIDGGPNARRAKKCMANVPWGEVEASTAEVMRRLDHAIHEHRVIFIRAVPSGDGHPAESLRFEGDPEPEIDDDDDEGGKKPKGPYAAAEALAKVSLGLLRTNEQQSERLERVYGELAEQMVKAQLYQYHSEALMVGGKSELVTRMVEQMGPAFVAQLPQILATVLAYQAGQEIPAPAAAEEIPTDPAQAIPWHIDRILSSAAALQAAFAAAPEEARKASMPALLKLRSLVQAIAPLVGLRVAPAEAPPETEQED